MNPRIDLRESLRRPFGWIGLSCLLLIIPIKAIRFTEVGAIHTIIVGIAPSLLGPAGLMFIILSSSGKLARLTLLQVAMLAAVIALGLEFAQLIPRPGILANVRYMFDWLDILATVVSICLGYLLAFFMISKRVM